MKSILQNKKGFIFLTSLLAVVAITIPGCKSSSLDVVYQDISEVGKKTVEYVKTKPYKHNLQVEGF